MKLIPTNDTAFVDHVILTRFVIESRGSWRDRAASHLVVYDRTTKDYLRDEGGRAFRHFKNSDEVYTFLRESFGNGTLIL